MDTGDLIDAVRAHRAVELVYRGRQGVGHRIVHPHAVYRTTSGALRLDGVQVSGVTSSGSLPGWRNFDLMQVVEVRVLDAEFDLAAEFNPAAERYGRSLALA